MEIILALLFIGLMAFLSFVKTRLPIKWQLIGACLAGIGLLVWFWGFENGAVHWKILITVVVGSSIFNLVRKLRASKHHGDHPVAV